MRKYNLNLKKINLFFILLFVFATYLQSCALITAGKQVLPIQTQPKDASIYIDGLKVGTGNYLAILPRKYKKPVIEVKKEGYETVNIVLHKKVRTGYLVGDIVQLLLVPFWGLPSIIVDASTGA